MSVILSWKQPKVGRFALFYLGFRPFFLLAAFGATLLGLVWLLALTLPALVQTAWPNPALWHGHEMVFGFGFAVITGFLLTAIRNWTGIQTLHRWPLAVLALLWLAARFANALDGGLIWAFVFDTLFGLGAATAITAPIVQARQWKQMGLISKTWLLALANMASYGFATDLAWAQGWILFGLLLIVAVLLTMIHRVVPFFIEKAAQMQHGITLKLPRFETTQKLNLIVFLLFTAGWILWPHHWLTGAMAWALALLNGRVLAAWFHPVLFKEPLLWSLWGGYAFMVLGFALAGLSFFPAASWLAVHAFGAGAMGLTTMGMMARVTLGHTGRNVFEPGKLIGALLALILISALVRIFGPLFLTYHYTLLMQFGLILWTLGWGLFTIYYLSQWLRPRVDGHYG